MTDDASAPGGKPRDAAEDAPTAGRTAREDPTTGRTTRDDPTSPSRPGRPGGDAPDPAGAAGQPGDAGRGRRRRRLVIGGIVGGLLLILVLGCVAVVAVLRSGSRLVDQADEREDRSARARQACVELETRLNRLVPPGATGGDPRRRATAIRAENAALRPFLTDIERPVGDGDRRRHGRPADVAAWQQLVDARTRFADALDRQATGGEPAFFLAPRSPRGAQVTELLERAAPETCTGAVRRLAHPDL